SVLYDCLFPDPSAASSDGWLPLLAPAQVRFGTSARAILDGMAAERAATGRLAVAPRLGVDVGAGGDESVGVVRWGSLAAVAFETGAPDTMATAGAIQEAMRRFGVAPEDVSVDDIGVGRGLTDRLRELGVAVEPVSVGSPARDAERYVNA